MAAKLLEKILFPVTVAVGAAGVGYGIYLTRKNAKMKAVEAASEISYEEAEEDEIDWNAREEDAEEVPEEAFEPEIPDDAAPVMA